MTVSFPNYLFKYDSRFSLSHACHMLNIIFIFYISLPSLKFNILLYLSPYRALKTLRRPEQNAERVSHMNLVNCLAHQESLFLAQWIERPPGVWEVIASLCRLRYFSLSHARDMLNISSFPCDSCFRFLLPFSLTLRCSTSML